MDINLVERWLRKDPVRWTAGAISGLFAGLLAMAFAVVISAAWNLDPWFPVKLIGTIPLGPGATGVDAGFKAIASGLAIHEGLCMLLGILYAHFSATNLLHALLGIGFVWGVFSWIFIWNLFMQSFNAVFAAQVPPGPAFFVCMVFGLSLTSVAFFDRAFRKA